MISIPQTILKSSFFFSWFAIGMLAFYSFCTFFTGIDDKTVCFANSTDTSDNFASNIKRTINEMSCFTYGFIFHGIYVKFHYSFKFLIFVYLYCVLWKFDWVKKMAKERNWNSSDFLLFYVFICFVGSLISLILSLASFYILTTGYDGFGPYIFLIQNILMVGLNYGFNIIFIERILAAIPEIQPSSPTFVALKSF